MTLRIIFDSADLRRIRFADHVDVMWELVLALQMAQDAPVPLPFMPWRQRLAVDDADRTALGPLQTLVSVAGDFPDFLTPHQGSPDINTACELLSTVPPKGVREGIAATFIHRAATPQARSLASADRRSMRELVSGARAGHRLLVTSIWPHMVKRVAVERARRSRLLVQQGLGAMLRSLPGVLGWDGRVMETCYPLNRTVHLAGRGLVLTPAYFCWGNPITWIDPQLTPVLVYQARQSGDPVDGQVDIFPALAALVGRTRAEALRILLRARSTTELADHLGTSVGTASKQAAILRDAGLVTSTRFGGSVLHRTSGLGNKLLITGAAAL